MNNYIKVEGHSNLYRDRTTGAIVNMDDSGYNNYLKSLKIRDKKKEELDEMRKDIGDIKDALKEILNRLA
tara:strand:- start:1165 stop:1374 length:210 start_codon:yes stop_codon:yes gene_type:complete